MSLLRRQVKEGVSIFLCDGYTVFSDAEVELIPGPPVHIMTERVAGSFKCTGTRSNDTALDSNIFVKVWERVSSHGMYQKYDWIVQVAVDAVFLPQILRKHLHWYETLTQGSPADSVYFNACTDGPRGPIKIISHGGMEVYNMGFKHCRKTLVGNDLGTCNDDIFVWRCMAFLGLGKVDNLDLLSEESCDHSIQHPTSCTPGPVAFHPFKTPTDYFNCLAQVENV